MTAGDALEAGRQSFGRRAWAEAYTEADRRRWAGAARARGPRAPCDGMHAGRPGRRGGRYLGSRAPSASAAGRRWTGRALRLLASDEPPQPGRDGKKWRLARTRAARPR